MTGWLTKAAGVVFAGLCVAAAGFHAAIIAGMPWGEATMGGRWPGQVPVEGRVMSLVSLAVLLLMARIVTSAAGLAPFRARPWMVWATAAYLGLAVVLHVITPSPLERTLWLPPILVMFVSVTFIEVARGRG